MAKKKDFWGSFSENVDFQPAANLIATGIIKDSEAEEEADRQFYAEQQKKFEEGQKLRVKMDALDKWITGEQDQTVYSKVPQNRELKTKYDVGTDKLTVEPPVPIFPLLKARTDSVPFNQKEMIGIGTNAGLTNEQIIKRLTPEKPNLINVKQLPNKTVAFDKGKGQDVVIKDYGEERNPYYIPKYVDRTINPEGRVEFKNGIEYLAKDKGRYDINTGEWLNKDGTPEIFDTQRVKVTRKESNDEETFSDEINKAFNKYFATTTELLAMYDSLKTDDEIARDRTGKPIMRTTYDKHGIATTESLTKAGLRQQLENQGSQYANFVKNVSTPNFKEWYKGIYNLEEGEKKAGTNPNPEDFYKNLTEAYKKKQISERDLKSGTEIFKATYMFDPIIYEK